MDKVDRYSSGIDKFTVGAVNRAHVRARMRKVTLSLRRVWNDSTKDGIKCSTFLYVFVGGRYHHVLDKDNYKKYICKDYEWCMVTGVRYNKCNKTIIVKLSGIKSRWFHVPVRFHKYMYDSYKCKLRNNVVVGNEVLLYKNYRIIDYDPWSRTDVYPEKL